MRLFFKCLSSDLSAAPLVLLITVCTYIFSYAFTFSLFVSLTLKWASLESICLDHAYLVHSANLFLWIEVFNLFTFNVISEKGGFIYNISLFLNIYLFCSHIPPSLLPPFVLNEYFLVWSQAEGNGNKPQCSPFILRCSHFSWINILTRLR